MSLHMDMEGVSETVILAEPPANSHPARDGEEEMGSLFDVTFLEDYLPSAETETPTRKTYHQFQPKALGVSQITLGVFVLNSVCVGVANRLDKRNEEVTRAIGSLAAIVAGSVAIAARSLHVPTLKACLGTQLAACLMAVFNVVVVGGRLSDTHLVPHCWRFTDYNNTSHDSTCNHLMNAVYPFYVEWFLVQATLLCISVTLTIYSCKLLRFCSPAAPGTPGVSAYSSPAR
ncbi:uncharacterized protein LOC105020730 isoform X1 [Esox lucius]|uniref:Uncharacterized protein n=1 Tax=Esox lucius TaxID=8010 RepID=A0A3P8ZU69_ESOLU|nr:uncharacterized protein LOC105020730 isoform X1 [Esox lucius]XP_019898822.2 uncharacterized protein LOC105020730 isoform X1 [Esox lucius]